MHGSCLYSLRRTYRAALPQHRPRPSRPADSSGPRQLRASGNVQPRVLPEPAPAHSSHREATSPPWHLPNFSQGPSPWDRHTAASAKGVLSSEIRLPAPRPAASGFTISAFLGSPCCRNGDGDGEGTEHQIQCCKLITDMTGRGRKRVSTQKSWTPGLWQEVQEIQSDTKKGLGMDI